MTALDALHNFIAARRRVRKWSQADLARRAGVSRAEVSAIETRRHVPSASVALRLAAALGSGVEDLFRLGEPSPSSPAWAWPPSRPACRYWQASVFGRDLLYPAEDTPLGTLAGDGVLRGGKLEPGARIPPDRTLVLAGCDPAVGFLAAEVARTSDFRVVPLTRSSQKALELLRDRLVHAAGVHLARAGSRGGNARAARRTAGPGLRLLRVARWEEGIALAPGLRVRSVRAALRGGLRWVGREEGSGARRLLDRLLAGEGEGEGARRPRITARDHRTVAEAIRAGWADAGICVRHAAEEAGLDFLGVEVEDYDLCYPADLAADPRLAALTRVVRSSSFRQALGSLKGYDIRTTGEIEAVP